MHELKRLKEILAGSHNTLYRGKDITDLFYNGTLSKQIAAGTFDDIYIGDYIIGKQSNRKYVVADIDYRLHTGDTECTTHHILMIPEKTMGNENMNESNTSAGAYIGSLMYTSNLNSYRTIIKEDFGTNHILKHKEYFANAMETNVESSWIWTDSEIDLLNEFMVYGSVFFQNATKGSNIVRATTIDKTQLALFRLKPDTIIAQNNSGARDIYWLRDVASYSSFCAVVSTGMQGVDSASRTHGVRPAFLVY